MFIALTAVLLIEVLFLFSWAPFYFRTGIVLFNQRIAASPAELGQLSLAGLERDIPIRNAIRLVFHALPDGSVAFRESFAPFFGRRNFPVMRGLLVVDKHRREVQVIGRCSWLALILTVLAVPITLVLPEAWPTLACPLIFCVSYYIQRRRYVSVVEAVRARVRSELPRGFVDPRR